MVDPGTGHQQPDGNPPPDGSPPPGDKPPPPGNPPAWGDALSVAAAVGSLDHPAVSVIDGSGNALAVWAASVSGNHPRIYASRFTAGGSWSAPQALSEPGFISSEPRMAMDPAGNAMLVWRQGNSITTQEVKAVRYTPASGWGGVYRVNLFDAVVTHLDVGINENGEAMVWWGERQPAGSGFTDMRINISRHNASEGWIGPVRYFPAEAAAPVSMSVAVADNGEALLVYSGRETGNAVVRSASYYPGQGWQYPETLQTGGSTTVYDEVAVAIDDEGRAAALWKATDGASTGIFAATRDDEAVWSDALRLNQGAGTVRDARLSMGQDGKAVAVWVESLNAALERLAAATFNGTEWSQSIYIDADDRPTADLRYADYPSVTAAGNRHAVVWRQLGDSGYDAKARLFEAGAWGDAKLIETNAGTPRRPSVSGNRAGKVLALWIQGQSSVLDLWSNFFK